MNMRLGGSYILQVDPMLKLSKKSDYGLIALKHGDAVE